MSSPAAPASPRRRTPLTLRRLLLPIHRWVGLTLGLIVLASAVTGAGMAFRKELDPIVYSKLLRAPVCARRLPMDAFVTRARALHPQGKLDYIRILERPDAPVILRFSDKDTYFFDPCSGTALGEQNRYEGVFGRLEQLHRFVYVPNGGWLMGAGALAAALCLVTLGLIVWWPRSPRRLGDALKLNTRLKGQAFELDLHRTLGAWAAVMLLFSALTAQPQAFEAVKAWLNTVTGTPEEKPPQSAPPPKVPGQKPAKIPMEQAWRTVLALNPHPREVLMHLPLKAKSPVEIFVIGADAPHANARTYLYLDAYTGRVLRFTPYARMGLGQKIYFWTLSLHTGEVGGVFGQFLLFLGALSVPVLAWTGIGSYLRRRLRKSPARTAERLAGSGSSPTRTFRIAAITQVSPGVKQFELVAEDGSALPAAEAGAHIDVHLDAGMVRQYSLLNGPGDRGRYLIAVRRDPASRGGSRAMHDGVNEGDLIEVGGPRNHFPIRPEATVHRLFARGIGITPILAMARALIQSGADFRLDYFSRSAEHTPFLQELSAPAFEGRVRFHHGLDPEAQRERLNGLLAERAAGAHLYVCGGRSFMDMVEGAAAPAWPAEVLHREYFTANPEAWAGDRKPFEVKLERSGRTIHVPAELTLAEALRTADVHVDTSCEQGVCGTCMTRVLDGVPDHRDAVLSSKERAACDRMLVCVSRALSPELTLDL